MRQVHRLVNSMHPAEVASLLESLPPAQREVVWDLVDPEIEGDVLVELNEEVRARPDPRDGNRRAGRGGRGPRGRRPRRPAGATCRRTVNQQVLRSMDSQDRERLNAVLGFDDDTAGGLMNTDTVSVRPDVTLETVLRYLRMRGEIPDKTDALFVVNRHDRLPRRRCNLTRLLTEDPERTVGEVMDTDVDGIPPETPASRGGEPVPGPRPACPPPVVSPDGTPARPHHGRRRRGRDPRRGRSLGHEHGGPRRGRRHVRSASSRARGGAASGSASISPRHSSRPGSSACSRPRSRTSSPSRC